MRTKPGTTSRVHAAEPRLHPTPSEAPARRRWRWCVVGLAVTAATWAVAGSLWLFPLLTENNDEGAYLAQSSALRAGQLLPDAPQGLEAAFRPWFSAARHSHYVYKYTPVHAAQLAIGRGALGSERATLALWAASDIVLLAALARELGASPRAAVFAAALLGLSPLFIIQSTTFLPYSGSLAQLLGFALLVLKGCRRGSRPMIFGAGVLFGIAFFARPYDAVLFGVPVLLWQSWQWRNGSLGIPFRRAVAWFALGTLPGLALLLGYNAVATGNPFRLPFNMPESSDTLGFGRRRTDTTVPYFDFTFSRAWRGTLENLSLLFSWAFGSFVTLFLAGVGLCRRGLLRGRSLLVALMVTWPAGLFAFWGTYTYINVWDGGRFLGPYYYLPMLVPLAIAGGVGLDEAARVSRAVAVVATVLMLGLAVPVLAEATSTNRHRTDKREVVMAALRHATAGHRALVFVPGLYGPFLQHPFSFVRNEPGLDGPVVYALEQGAEDFDVIAAFPHRDVFTLSVPNAYPGGENARVVARVDRVQVRTGREIDVAVNVPSRLRDGSHSLRLAVGHTEIDVPIGLDGTARAGLAPTAGGISIVAGDGASLLQVATSPTTRLRLAVIGPTVGGTRTLVGRDVPFRASRGQLTVLWPGSSAFEELPAGKGVSWSATPRNSP